MGAAARWVIGQVQGGGWYRRRRTSWATGSRQPWLRRLLPTTLLGLMMCTSTASIAVAIDLSPFNAVQVILRTGDMVWESTYQNGSKTTRKEDHLTYDTTGLDFKRGHFVGNTYTASWNEERTVAPGKVWRWWGSVSITVSATDPPDITDFYIEDSVSDPDGTGSFLAAGPPGGAGLTVIPYYFYYKDSRSLVFRVTDAATCQAYTMFIAEYQWQQPTVNGVVREEITNPSASFCANAVQEYLSIALWVLAPTTPVPSATPTVTPTPTRTATPTNTPTPTITPTPTSPLIVEDVDVVQAIALRREVTLWSAGQPATWQEVDAAEQLRYLVAAKDTWVRVYVGNTSASSMTTKATLNATRHGQVLSALPSQSQVARPGWLIDRANPAASFTVYDFQLPRDWLQGDVDVSVELDPGQQPGANDRLLLPFQPQKPFHVSYVLFDGVTQQNVAVAQTADALLRNWYPALVRYDPHAGVPQPLKPGACIGTLPMRLCQGPGDPVCHPGYCEDTGTVGIHFTLATVLHLAQGNDVPDILFGWIPGTGPNGQALRDEIGSTDQGNAGNQPYGPRSMVAFHTAIPNAAPLGLPHEIGHLFQMEHPTNAFGKPWSCPGCPLANPFRPTNHAPPPFIEEVLVADLQAGALRGRQRTGPARTDFSFMWNSHTATGDTTWSATIDRNAGNVWITQSSWKWLFDKLAPGGSAPSTTDDSAVVLLRGLIFAGGTAAFGAALPAVIADPPRASGSYCLRLENATGQALSTQCFEPMENEPGDSAVRSVFVQAVPWPADLARVRLLQGTTVLAEASVSAHRPAVQITNPTADHDWQAMETIEWAAQDADGDPLSYTVQYSRDDRQSWTALATDLSDAALTVDAGVIPGGEAAWLRVVASDGLNVGTDEVGPLRVPKKVPRLFIAAPPTASVFPLGARVSLQGTGYDPEDGGFTGTDFRWTSDRDGELGQGSTWITRTLSLGLHHITLSTTDSDGNLGTTSIDIRIAPACGGDCSADGSVSIDEILTGVNMALGNTGVIVCPSFDADRDGRVTIDEILAAVHDALNGCPLLVFNPSPTPIGTSGPTPTETPRPLPSRTPTRVRSPSPTGSPSPVWSPTRTPTRMPTSARTPTPTPTPTATAVGPRLYCHTPAVPVAIPDNNSAGATDSIVIADVATISDLNVRLTLTHTFVADLVVALIHVESGRRVVLLDRPGFPILSGGGCGSDNISATLDDEAAGLCENLCAISPPAIGGPCRPNGWLGLFDGDGSSGTWRLEIIDTAVGDTGALQSWCVEMATGPPPTPSGPAAPVITDVTCDGLDQCFPNFGESFALQFRFYDVNQDANHWRIDAEVTSTGATYFIDAQDFAASSGEIITRFHSGITCTQPPCATVGVSFHVVVSDTSGRSSAPRSVDVVVLGSQ